MTLAKNKAVQTMLPALLAAVLFAGPFFANPANAQSATGSIEATTIYESAYPKVNASSNSSFTVQSQYHIYKPGDAVRIEGSMSSEMREETQAEEVAIQVIDAQGVVTANQQAAVSSNGEYSATINLPSNAQQGEYDINSTIEVDASLLGLLDAEITANLESSAQFVVGSANTFEVTVEAEDGGQAEQFEVDITSNSNVDAVQMSHAEKTLSFMVEGETGTRGVTEVTIPKAMLSGEMVVLIDGQAVAAESNDVIVKSNTDTHITFEINYSHSEHKVEVQGTTVAPEFPVSVLVMAAAIGSIVAAIAVGKKKGFFSGA